MPLLSVVRNLISVRIIHSRLISALISIPTFLYLNVKMGHGCGIACCVWSTAKFLLLFVFASCFCLLFINENNRWLFQRGNQTKRVSYMRTESKQSWSTNCERRTFKFSFPFLSRFLFFRVVYTTERLSFIFPV